MFRNCRRLIPFGSSPVQRWIPERCDGLFTLGGIEAVCRLRAIAVQLKSGRTLGQRSRCIPRVSVRPNPASAIKNEIYAAKLLKSYRTW